MAGARYLPCVGPSYQLADRKAAVQRAVNLYLGEIEGPGEAYTAVLRSAPGTVLHLDLGAAVRGSYATDDRWFVVAGSTLYELTTGVAVARGSLLTPTGFVSMKHGRDQLVIVDGPNGYVLRLNTNAFVAIIDADWRGSDWVEELDGYFIFVDPNTDQFYLSAIDDASDLNALDFSSADAQPDNIVTHRVLRRELFLMGSRSIEVWVDSGDPDFPLVRYNATPIDVGVMGVQAATLAADSLFFVGQTTRGRGLVYVMQGHQPVRVSTRAVEEALAGSSDLSQCSMWAYQISGAEFVAVNAPGLETTWVYDAAAKVWHERARLISGSWQPYPADHVVQFGGEHYASWESGIYRLDPEAYSLDGIGELARERTWPHLLNPGSELTQFRSLELACTTGYGGSITLEISNDGGITWGPPLLRSLGAIGRWMERVRWHFLGASRDRVFRLRCTDAVPLTIHGANIDAGAA